MGWEPESLPDKQNRNLTTVADDGTTGITVQFHLDIAILVSPEVMAPEVTRANSWPQLRVVLVDERPR